VAEAATKALMHGAYTFHADETPTWEAGGRTVSARLNVGYAGDGRVLVLFLRPPGEVGKRKNRERSYRSTVDGASKAAERIAEFLEGGALPQEGKRRNRKPRPRRTE
jgi:hypothetical protein